MRVFALIPAAGHSTRMGRDKLALPLGRGCVLDATITALRRGGADMIVVILAPHVSYLEKIARTAGAEVVVLPAATPDMRSTIEAGLRWLQDHRSPETDDWWLLSPADHPSLSPTAVERVIAAVRASPDCSVAVPMWNGRRGHPVAMRWRHAAALRDLPREFGLNKLVRDLTAATLEVAAPDDSILIDLDTPEDYEQLLRRFALHPDANG